ncbi:hypothetical protein Q1695_002142 [Nippostrongylus brasiliensis]|nr:hypothetical protein Q1695_002142 [Nippostrongylus brasiliensis]
MASYMHQLAMSWQNQMFTSFPLVSNYCAPLGIFGMTFFNSPTARIPEELDVAVNESICGGKSDCHSTFERERTRTKNASIARRLVRLCDKFEAEFVAAQEFLRVEESHCENQAPWFRRGLL